jgi:hypothetical protein
VGGAPRLAKDVAAVACGVLAAFALSRIEACDGRGGDAIWAALAFGVATAGALLPRRRRRSPEGGAVSAVEGLIQIGAASVAGFAIVAFLTTLGSVSCTG